ncbi:MAG: M48 family metalloprotease [Lewinella sp.]|nr:M48 family metalloprotease [Lewinella sp.]
MKRLHLLNVFLLLWIVPAGLTGQPNTTAFSLLEKSSAEINLEPSVAKEKRDRAEAIYRKLVEAKGDYRFSAPPFLFTQGEANIAFLQGDGLSIGLEEKAYDLLEEFGDAALAFILGHEVSHFYEKHAYQRGVFNSYNDKELASALQEAKTAMAGPAYAKLAVAVEKGRERLTKVTMETEADFLGGFLAYSAGYDVRDVPGIFEALYAGYGLEDEMFGYESKEARQEMGREAEARMNQFIDVYEVANLLVALNRYADARIVYKHILQQYQGREVYNNLGVLTVLEAMEYFSQADKQYRLPLELDLSFNSATKSVEDTEAFRAQLLIEAMGYFTSAISLDRDYAPAYLNLACTHYLLEDDDRARFYAGVEAARKAKANPERFPNTGANAEVLLALIDIRGGNESAGIERLSAVSNKSALAAANLLTAQGKEAPAVDRAVADRSISWTVDGLKAKDLLTATQNTSKSTRLDFFGDAGLNIWTRDNARVYRFSPAISSRRPKVSFAITNSGYTEETRDGFKVGSPGKDITDRFGQPARKQTTVAGEIWVYDAAILIMDMEGKLKRWAVEK